MATPRPKFSILVLILLTAVVCLGISHFNVSRINARLQSELSELRAQIGLLHTVDDVQIYATALPTYGPLQWRWRVQLPKEGRYRIRYAFEDLPESGLPTDSMTDDSVFLDSRRTPIPGGKPFILALAVFQDDDAVWRLTLDANSGRSSTWAIDSPPQGLGTSTGWTSSLHGKNETVSVSNTEPLVLLRYRKAEELPNGAITVDMQPTDGIMFWIEQLDDKD